MCRLPRGADHQHRHHHMESSLATSHALEKIKGRDVAKRADLTKRDSVFVEPSGHVWYADVFRTLVTSTEQTFSIAFLP